MSDQRPAPLSPPNVDLRDYQNMPVQARRLLQSETWIEGADEPKPAHAIMCLWLESWHQVPAGSLPDNDKVLARLAMCDGKAWRELKDKVMASWFLCSDGRWYHPVVVEVAQEAWQTKRNQNDRTEKARLAKQLKKQEREAAKTVAATIVAAMSEPAAEPVLEDVAASATAPAQEPSTETVTVAEQDATSAPMTETVTDYVTASKGREEKGIDSSEGKPSGSLFATPPPRVDDTVYVPLFLVRVEDGDYKKALFSHGLPWLADQSGKTIGALRPLVGKWLKEAGDDARKLFELLKDCERDKRADPVSWVTACLKANPGRGEPEPGLSPSTQAIIDQVMAGG